MPVDPVHLVEEFVACDLTLLAAYVAVDLAEPEVVEWSSEAAMRVVRNLAFAGSAAFPPVLILADDDGVEALRAARGGQISTA